MVFCAWLECSVPRMFNIAGSVSRQRLEKTFVRFVVPLIVVIVKHRIDWQCGSRDRSGEVPRRQTDGENDEPEGPDDSGSQRFLSRRLWRASHCVLDNFTSGIKGFNANLSSMLSPTRIAG